MKRPPALRPGDTVAVVAPAGPVPRAQFEAGARILGARYRLVHSERIFARTGFLAGDDAARRAELQAALDDPSLGAVVCARGGHGLLRIVAGLDPASLVAQPHWIVGFSDVTVLHAFAARAGVMSIHGPVITQLGHLPADDAQLLFATLESADAPAPLTGLRTLVTGALAQQPAKIVEGPLFGGNLEVLSRLAGTGLAASLDGAILLLEEVGERPYRIDRALTQLLLSGALDRVAGVVVGDLVGCTEKDGSPPSAEEVIAERLAPLNIPVVAGAPCGHGARNRALVLGERVRLDADAGTLTFQISRG